MPGTVYIRSKIKRFAKHQIAPLPENYVPPRGYMIVNVTSQQPKANAYRVAFSPMHVFNGPYNAPDGHTYACFEHYWQGLKHYPNRNHVADKEWWRTEVVAHRKLPRVDPTTCLYSSDEARFPGQAFNYIESRKTFYVPDYRAKIRNSHVSHTELNKLRNDVFSRGIDVIIDDFDGPRMENGHPAIAEVTTELLRAKLHDATFPFGHGYLVAAEILGIAPEEYMDAP